jgi:hypothetical protein
MISTYPELLEVYEEPWICMKTRITLRTEVAIEGLKDGSVESVEAQRTVVSVFTAGDPELYIAPEGGYVCQRVRTTKYRLTQKKKSVFSFGKAKSGSNFSKDIGEFEGKFERKKHMI